MKNKMPILLALICLAGSLSAQEIEGTKPFQLGVVDNIKSAILGENRVLNIYLPEGYNPSGKEEYPVIYVLDGGANEDFVHVSGIVQFLTQIVDTLPRAIVVGIANVDREHDFTLPAASEQYKKKMPSAGGADKFISFMEKELRPYIKEKYRASGATTLIGQSLGGLLATNILFNHTQLFDNYLIVSPSLWWNDESLMKDAGNMLGYKVMKPVNICIAVGTEGDVMERDAHGLQKSIKELRHKDIHVELLELPQETHRTILHNAVYKALPGLLHKK